MGPIESLLTEARAKIADPAHWTRFALARDEHGRAVGTAAESAVCYCAVGALYAAYDKIWTIMDKICNARLILCESTPGACIEDFNDDPNRSHLDILAVYDKAISLANERGI